MTDTISSSSMGAGGLWPSSRISIGVCCDKDKKDSRQSVSRSGRIRSRKKFAPFEGKETGKTRGGRDGGGRRMGEGRRRATMIRTYVAAGIRGGDPISNAGQHTTSAHNSIASGAQTFPSPHPHVICSTEEKTSPASHLVHDQTHVRFHGYH